MPLRQDRFNVYLIGRETDPVAVTITHQDQLRAETALAAQGTDFRDHPLLMTDAWCWSALLRMGELEKGTKLRDFTQQVAGLEDAGHVELGPTQPAPPPSGGSDSQQSGPPSTGQPPQTN